MPSSISRRDTSKPGNLAQLWFGVFAGPVAWLIDLQISHSAANRACMSGDRLPYALTSIIGALIVAFAGFVAWRQLQALAEADAQGAFEADRNRFLAITGIAFSAGFLLLLLGNLVPKLMLGLCD
jgi:hypothetical protein